MKKGLWVVLPALVLTGCAGTGYVHETYYGDGYYAPSPYPQTVYVHRETYYEPRPRVVVVDQPRTVVIRPPAPDHGYAEPRRMEERHEHRHEYLPRGGAEVRPYWGRGEGEPNLEEHREPRHEIAPPRELAARPLWRRRDPGVGQEQAPRQDIPTRHGAQEMPHRENGRGREEDRPR